MKSTLVSCLLLCVAFILTSCVNSNQHPPAEARFTLQLLHFADVDGGGTAAMLNVENFSALVNHFRTQRPANTLLLSSGDNYIPGPIFQASQDSRMNAVLGKAGAGRGEIYIQNLLGVQASAVGNHDLDTGPRGFADIISNEGDYPGARFPYLAANIDFATDAATSPLQVKGGQQANTLAGKVAPSTVITLAGEAIGIVGAVTPTLAAITSVGDLTILPQNFISNNPKNLDNLAAVIQAEVDTLRQQGINKIILLSHMQTLSVERALATRLEGGDIIVGGGSNTLLADNNDILHNGDRPADTYPLLYTSPINEPVLLVNTDGDYKYLGRLLLEFDAAGRVITGSLNSLTNGAWASTQEVVNNLNAQVDPEVAAVAHVIGDILSEFDSRAYGVTRVFLDGRRAQVRSRETNLGNLSADANLWYAAQMASENPPIISVKNGGGIRASIGQITSPAGSTSSAELQLLPPAANDFGKPAGGISQLDIQTALAFNNGLALVTVTAAELHDLAEHMVKGGFAHTAGLRLHFDAEAPARSTGDTNLGVNTDGQRVRQLEVLLAGNASERWDVVVRDGLLIGDPQRTFRLVALDFLASCAAGPSAAARDCGSGWPFKGLRNAQYQSLVDAEVAAMDPGRASFSNSGGEQDALAEFLVVFHPDAQRAYAVPAAINERLIPMGH
ncbi:MAG TPA: bifunctional metallophosphatase/5'-nucleotidase [Cellvibrionaceae bacterium]